jgi:biopolymer transport protein ExbD
LKLHHTKKDTADINLTPLIDVVFLLLIFFMVSTTFQREAELSIELPEASTEAQEKKDKPIEVAVDAGGRYYVNGRALLNKQPKTLKQALQKAAGDRSSVPVVISADANTSHQSVVVVMDAARQLGLLRLTFAARLTSEEAQ